MCESKPPYKIRKIWTAIDCGKVANLDGVKQLLEGGVIWGISQTHYEHTAIEKGAIKNSNFHDYAVAKMADAPEIICDIVESDFAPTGVGEPVVVCTPPAIVCALNQAGKQKFRSLPINLV